MADVRLTPAKALEYQIAMGRTVDSEEFAQLFWEGARPFLAAHDVPVHKHSEATADLANSFVNSVINGETVLLKDDTVRLVEYASHALPEDDRYDITLAPFESACVFFESPRRFEYVASKAAKPIDILLNWIVFGRIIMPGSEKETHVYFVGVRYPNDPWQCVRSIGMMMCAEYSILGNLKDRRGVEVLEEKGIARGPDYEVAVFNPKPFVQAMWALMRQPIVSEARVRPIEPHLRKKRKKMKNGATVRVLSVRQREGHGEGEPGRPSGRQYTHRWIVRGHWRMQAHGEGRKLRKRIWIDMHVAGPEGAPLLPGDRVYKV